MKAQVLCIAIIGLSLLAGSSPLPAVPITSGTGPGGVGTTDGLSDLEFWVRADAGVLNPLSSPAGGGDDAATWEDQSGNSFDFTSPIGQRPTFLTSQFNGLPAIDFTAAGTEFFERAAVVSSGNSARTIFIVTEADTTANVGILDLSHNASVGSGRRYIVTPEIAVRVSGNIVYDSAVSTTDPEVITLRNQTDDDVVDTDGFLNGAMLGVSGTPAAATLALDGTATVIGHHTGSEFYDGRIAEIAVFDRALNDAERVVAQNYLNSKYDLDNDGALTFTDDFYAGDLAANGDYDRDVFGVGRVDTSNIFSSSGQSGFGIEATSGFNDDGEFVLAGHNVENNGLTTADVGGAAEQRWERVWYVDVTDVDDDLGATLTFDFSDAGLSGPGPLDAVSLLFSSSDPFSFSQVTGITSASFGDQFSFTLPAGVLESGYYTLGLTAVPEPSSWLLLSLGMAWVVQRSNHRRLGRNKPCAVPEKDITA